MQQQDAAAQEVEEEAAVASVEQQDEDVETGLNEPLLASPEAFSQPVFEFSRERMLFGAIFVLFGLILLVLLTADAHGPSHHNLPIKCPTSPQHWFFASPRPSCAVNLQVTDFMCKDVQEEVERRLEYKDDWEDPNANNGIYILLDSDKIPQTRSTSCKRISSDDDDREDLMLFSYEDRPNLGCLVHACSVSQSSSSTSGSYNYCNIRNLFCGKAEGCDVCRHDMRPVQTPNGWGECQHHSQNECSSI